MAQSIPTGKLPQDLLARLLSEIRPSDPRVILGPGIGQDAAVIDMGTHYLVAKTDPITFATDDIGWYAVNVNANDIACMGAHPRWFMASALLPAGRADSVLAETIFSQIMKACSALGVSLVGGHTEITFDLPRAIVVGAMLGEVAKDRLVTSRGARPEDLVLLTKAIPLEGTALIAREKGTDLLVRGFSGDFVARASALLHTPGISVVPEALIAADAGLVTAMHDPTEGGLATGLWEIAHASNVGLLIDETAIPISNEGAQLCAAYGLDPLGLIASGSLLMTARPDHAQDLVARLAASGIPCAVIGRAVPANEGLVLENGRNRLPLPRFSADEIVKIL